VKKENKISIPIKNLGIKNITGTILSSSKIQDHNTFENPTFVKPKEFNSFKVKNGVLEFILPPFSVVVLEGKVN
jgi:alpha-N-arabinofuranosidase